jgi:DNA-binding transcriptional regulator/RsmH inhibitor MraZ
MQNEKNNKGICWGEFKSRLDEASRLRLSVKIVRQLDENHVDKLWIYSNPVIHAIVLCPDQVRSKYMDMVKLHLSKEKGYDIAYRKYICTGRAGRWDKHGRLYLPSFALSDTGLKKYSNIVILGFGDWFEVWGYDKWMSISGQHHIKVEDSSSQTGASSASHKKPEYTIFSENHK